MFLTLNLIVIGIGALAAVLAGNFGQFNCLTNVGLGILDHCTDLRMEQTL